LIRSVNFNFSIIHTHTYICIHTHTYINTHTHIYMYIHIYTHIRIYTHTYIHTHTYIIYIYIILPYLRPAVEPVGVVGDQADVVVCVCVRGCMWVVLWTGGQWSVCVCVRVRVWGCLVSWKVRGARGAFSS
jgi:hypothetical protein